MRGVMMWSCRTRGFGWGRPVVAGLLLAGLAAGCGGGGDDGPERFDVSGTVTYQGQPVTSGTITFDPDTSQGNSGPQGYAQIVDGQYDTAEGRGKGTVGGPHHVRISTPEFTYQRPEPIDLPKEASTQTFDLKESEVTPTPPGTEPA